MNAEQARQVDRVMRQLGIQGVVALEDPENLKGSWRVYNAADPATREDITADVLAAMAAKFQPSAPDRAPRRRSGPTRGFVLPPKDDE
ncbi:hypothetical protein [Streptomyces parvus]|uniref:hypothetical protein n=1 Tax=Streptomyces parvus TaxID=66428 RepID=UPI003D720C68